MLEITHEPPLTQTRNRILEALMRRPDSRVVDLAGELEMTAGSLRRHLDILAAEGYVQSRPIRRGQGRPFLAYSATERAQENASTGYGRLFERVLQGLAALPREQIAEADGSQLMDLLFANLGEDLARQYRSHVTAGTVAGRVKQVVEALSSEGILNGWEDTPEGFRLRNGICPYRRAAMASHGPCFAEQRAIELLVGVPVRQVSRIADGTASCEYLIPVAADEAVGV